jgi:hypothetical protein
VSPLRVLSRRLSLALLTTSAVSLGAALAVAQARITPVDLGTWQATTSTHQSFKFKIVKHGPSSSCGSTATARCFYALTYPSTVNPCPNGQSGGGLFAVPNGFVNLKGVFSYTYLAPTKENYVQFRVALSGAKGSGTLRDTTPQELGVENPPVCDSGTISFTARHL